jgi:hypothetical protein
MTEEMLPHPCSYAPPAATPDEIDDEGPVEMVREQEAPMAHEVILADAKPEMP